MNLDQSDVEISHLIVPYCSLFDSSADAIVVLHRTHGVVYQNSAFNSQFGKGVENLTDITDVHEIWTENIDKIWLTNEEVFLKDKKTGIEFRSLNLNGEVFCMVSVPTINGLTLAISPKRSSKKPTINKADQDLIDNVVKNAPQAIMILDYDKKKYVAVNDKACSLLGYTTEELQNITLGEISTGAMEDGKDAKEVANEKMLECISSNKRIVFEWLIRRKNGTLLPCEISVFRLPTQNGTYIRSSIIDISFKHDIDKTLVEQSSQFNESINQAVKEQQENQLKAFVRDSPIPVAMLDNNMNFLLVADEWLKKFPTEHGDDIIGRNYYELNPNIPLRWKLLHKQALKGSASGMKRDQFVDSYGNKAWIRWDLKPWYRSEKEVGGIILYAQDITEEVESENKILNQEKRYKHFFNSDSIGWIEISAPKLLDTVLASKASFKDIVQEDKDILGKVSRYNRRIADIFGLPVDLDPTEFEPLRYVIDGLDELSVQLFEAIRSKLDTFSCEVQIKNKYDELRYLNINVHFSDLNGGGDILYGIQDVTDLKESVKALRESEERYRTMFDSNSLAVVYTNYQKEMVKINESFTKIFGYTEEDMQTLDENDMLVPSYRKLNEEIMRDFQNGVKRYVSLEKEYIIKSGAKIVAQTASSALYDDQGVHYGNVTIIEDITERKTADRKIRKQNEELIKINQELDQFVYSAAHDLRAPIANVMGLVKLIRLEEISAMASQYLDLQEKSLGKLDEFIKSIVDYSRNSRLELAKDEIQWDEFVNDVVDQYRFSENAEKLKITIDVDQPGTFITDQNRLSVVMNNLVSNAVRYMDVKKDNCFLNIHVKSDDKQAKISVSDNGIGIEEEHLASIFDLFYRANSSSKGTGIGLYIVKETIDKLKGKVKVESEYEKGTTFTVTIKNFA